MSISKWIGLSILAWMTTSCFDLGNGRFEVTQSPPRTLWTITLSFEGKRYEFTGGDAAYDSQEQVVVRAETELIDKDSRVKINSSQDIRKLGQIDHRSVMSIKPTDSGLPMILEWTRSTTDENIIIPRRAQPGEDEKFGFLIELFSKGPQELTDDRGSSFSFKLINPGFQAGSWISTNDGFLDIQEVFSYSHAFYGPVLGVGASISISMVPYDGSSTETKTLEGTIRMFFRTDDI